MNFLEIKEDEQTVLVNIDNILMCKLSKQQLYASAQCIFIMADNTVLRCDEKYFSMLQSKIS